MSKGAIMGLYSVEQDHITISDFINSLNETDKKKIDLDYLLKLFIDEKLNFYLKIKGNKNEIYISDRHYICSTHIETSGNNYDNLFVTSEISKGYKNRHEINLKKINFILS